MKKRILSLMMCMFFVVSLGACQMQTQVRNIPGLDELIEIQATLGREGLAISVEKPNRDEVKIRIEIDPQMESKEVIALMFDTMNFFIQDDVVQYIINVKRDWFAISQRYNIGVNNQEYAFGLNYGPDYAPNDIPQNDSGLIPFPIFGIIGVTDLSNTDIEENFHVEFTGEQILNRDTGLEFSIDDFTVLE